MKTTNDTPAQLLEQRNELRAALQDTLRFLVTANGLPDKGKGRTDAQQAAYDRAVRAILSAGGPL